MLYNYKNALPALLTKLVTSIPLAATQIPISDLDNLEQALVADSLCWGNIILIIQFR